MKSNAQLQSKPNIKAWLKEGGRFLSWEVLILFANALTGFIIVRELPKLQYAQYTLALSAVSMFTNLTNMGLTPALSGIGGRFWNDGEKMRSLVDTVMGIRRRIAWWLGLPVLAFSGWQLHKLGVSPGRNALLLAACIPHAMAQLESGIYKVVSQLQSAIRSLQWIDLQTTLVKFGGAWLIVSVTGDTLWLLLWLSLVFSYYAYRLRLDTNRFMATEAPTSPYMEQQVRDIVRPNVIRTIYCTFESQISLFLCVWLTNAEYVASFGALGRLSIFFTLITSFVFNYLIPRLAKAKGQTQTIRLAGAVLVANILPAIPLLIIANRKPEWLLWLLGEDYATITTNVFPFLLVSMVGNLAAAAYQVCAAKGWIALNRFYLPVSIAGQALLLFSLRPKSFEQIIVYQGLLNLLFFLFNGYMFYFEGKRQNWHETA